MGYDRERKEVEEVWFAPGQCALLGIGGGKRMKVEQELEYCLEVDVVLVEWTVGVAGRWIGADGRLVVVVGMMDVVAGMLVAGRKKVVGFDAW